MIDPALPTTDPQEWKSVPGYEGFYDVSSSGRIRYARDTLHRRAGDPVRVVITKFGYIRVFLYHGYPRRWYHVHRLIALTFLGANPPGRHQVNHIDGNKQNNTVVNLEWCSPAENIHHSYRIGLKGGEKEIRGVDRVGHKLNDEIVRHIRRTKGRYGTYAETAAHFGISHQVLWRIYVRKDWAHVTD
jgi:hypothetical protein